MNAITLTRFVRGALGPALLVLLGAARPALAQPGLDSHVHVSAKADRAQVHPRDTFVVAVILDHDMHFHTWPAAAQDVLPKEIADFAERTVISYAGSDVPVTPGPIQLPTPAPAPVPDLVNGGTTEAMTYQGQAVAFIPFKVDATAEPGSIEIPVRVYYQACDDKTCFRPQDETATARVEIVPAGAPVTDATTAGIFAPFDRSVFDTAWQTGAQRAPAATPATTDSGDDARGGFFGLHVGGGFALLALFGFIGGFILNLTPCVLPVIPIKILTLSQHAGESRLRAAFLGLWMALGVVAFWVGIGVPVAFLTVADPSRVFGIWWVTLAIGLIIGVMGVGIMGAFAINLPKQVYMINPKAETAGGSFLFGVMTAVLGLPCFGFVAGALVPAALTQGQVVVLVLFTSMGVGMAAPYFVLSAFPQLLKKMPRTGPASELIKQVMGLLLIAAAFYFIGSGVFALLKSDPVRAANLPWWSKSIHWWLISLASVAAGFWLILRTMRITKRPAPRVVFTLVGLVFSGVGVLIGVNRTNKALHDFWSPYTPETLAGAISHGDVVVIDFTADWCINCQVLKATVLERDPVKGQLRSDGVVPLVADLTSNQAPGWTKLEELGYAGIPTLAIYGPGLAEPWVANAYTSDQVMHALARARGEVARADGS